MATVTKRNAAAYSNEPATQDVDKVRLLLGDTDCTQPLLSDNEINWLVSVTEEVTAAAAMGAKAIAGKFARKVSNTTGRVRKELSDIFDHYMALEKNLRDLASAGGIASGGIPSVAPVFTALTFDGARSDASDPDKVQPVFERGDFDNPRAPSSPEGKAPERGGFIP